MPKRKVKHYKPAGGYGPFTHSRTEWSLALINLKFICLLSEDPVHHPHWSKKKNEVTSLIADYLTMRLIALGYMLPVTEHYLNYPDQTPLSAMIKNINQENNI